MKTSIRVALLTCAVLSALAFASARSRRTSPSLVVTSPTPQAAGGGAVRIGVVVANSDDPTARRADLHPERLPARHARGRNEARRRDRDGLRRRLGGAILPLTGELDSRSHRNPAEGGARSVRRHGVADWNLHLTRAGQTLDVPMYVVAGNAAEVRRATRRSCSSACPRPTSRRERRAGRSSARSCSRRPSAPRRSRAHGDRRVPVDVAVHPVHAGEGHGQRRGDGRDAVDPGTSRRRSS